MFVRRSNDVIPEVLGAAEEGGEEIVKPTVCPACGFPLQEVGANLYCVNAENCRPQIVARLSHYCEKGACDIEGPKGQNRKPHGRQTRRAFRSGFVSTDKGTVADVGGIQR